MSLSVYWCIVIVLQFQECTLLIVASVEIALVHPSIYLNNGEARPPRFQSGNQKYLGLRERKANICPQTKDTQWCAEKTSSIAFHASNSILTWPKPSEYHRYFNYPFKESKAQRFNPENSHTSEHLLHESLGRNVVKVYTLIPNQSLGNQNNLCGV